MKLNFLFGAITIVLLMSCSKKLMVNKVRLIDTKANSQINLASIIPDSVTTFICVRHAEKQLNIKNPDLTPEGVKRAADLADILEGVSLDAIYSTDYKRTLSTARPTSINHKLKIQSYHPGDLKQFVADQLEVNHKKTVLVVGHSNTTPEVVNILTGDKKHEMISEKIYDNLYVVVYYSVERVEVKHLKFGDRLESH